MLVFLCDVRASLISGLTIPLSIFIALIILAMSGVDLTVMSMGGLAIGVGKVASGTIIMVENIVRVRRERAGKASALELTYEAAKDVGTHLFATSLIIILVFLPLLSLQGIEGAMFKPTAIAVAAALFGALILNLTLQPLLCSMFLKVDQKKERKDPIMGFLSEKYEAALRYALDRQRAIVISCVVLSVGAAGIYQLLGKEFVPPLDEGSIMASTVMLPETSLEEAARVGGQVEEIFMSFPEVVSVTRTSGSAEGAEHVHPVNHSHYNLLLVPREERDRGFEELTEAMRQELSRIPGVTYLFEQPIGNKIAEMLTGTGGELAIKVFGNDWDILNDAIEEIRHVMEDVEGVADLQVEQTAGIPQLVVDLDRGELARYGIPVGDVADLVETALNGIEVTDVYEEDRITSILLRLSEESRHDEETGPEPPGGCAKWRANSHLPAGGHPARAGPSGNPEGEHDASEVDSLQRGGPGRGEPGGGGPAGDRCPPGSSRRVLHRVRGILRKSAEGHEGSVGPHGDRSSPHLRDSLLLLRVHVAGISHHPRRSPVPLRSHRGPAHRRPDHERVVHDRAHRPHGGVRSERRDPHRQDQRLSQGGDVAEGRGAGGVHEEVPGHLHDQHGHDRGVHSAGLPCRHRIGTAPAPWPWYISGVSSGPS